MKRSILATFLILAASCAMAAEGAGSGKKSAAGGGASSPPAYDYAGAAFAPRGPFGLGLFLGISSGIDGKFFFDDYSAVHATFGFDFFSSSINLQADYNFHFRDLLVIGQEELVPYLGAGGYFGISGSANQSVWAGIRFPVGLAYQIRPIPLDVSFEVVPGLRLARPANDGIFGLGGGVAIRWWFDQTPSFKMRASKNAQSKDR